MPVKVGLVGLGRWGANYLTTIPQVPGCSLAGVADSSKTAIVQSRVACPSFTRLEDLLALSDLDAVVVATPDPTHYEFSLRCLESGRHVLVEKPMTRDSTEAAELAALAESRGLVLAVGHIALYHVGITHLRAVVRTAEAPQEVVSRRTSRGPTAASEAPLPLWDLGPHDVATTISLFGEPCSVRARASGRSVLIEMLFSSEMKALLGVEYRNGAAERWLEVRLAGRAVRHDERTAERDWREANCRSRVADSPLFRQCEDFVRCCATGAEPASSGRLGLAVTRSLEAAERSLEQSGRWLPLSEPALCP